MALAKEKRVVFRFSTPVEKIIIENDTATGVMVKGAPVHFDAVISNADVLYSSAKLFKNPDEIKLTNRELTYSALVFMWGVKRTSPKLDCYNMILGGNTEKEYDLLFGRKIISYDPVISIYISSKINKSDAPSNCENWQVRINAPVNSGQDWNTQISQSRILILKRIYEAYGIDLKKDIIFERIITPVTLERDYNCYKGAVHGVHPNKVIATFSEHPNKSTQIKNLFFTGGSVNPGGNIPMALLSAQIVDNLIQKEHPTIVVEPTLF
jgi:phytoene dehydrogenase-like protein